MRSIRNRVLKYLEAHDFASAEEISKTFRLSEKQFRRVIDGLRAHQYVIRSYRDGRFGSTAGRGRYSCAPVKGQEER